MQVSICSIKKKNKKKLQIMVNKKILFMVLARKRTPLMHIRSVFEHLATAINPSFPSFLRFPTKSHIKKEKETSKNLFSCKINQIGMQHN